MKWRVKETPSMTGNGVVRGPVCAWNIVSPGCGTILREEEDIASLSAVEPNLVRMWLTQGRSCRLAKRQHTLGNISLKVWDSGVSYFAGVLLGVGLALEIGLRQTS